MNQRGQAIIESLVAISTLTAFIVLVVSMIGLGLGRVWIDQLAYRGALCLLKTQQKYLCEQKTHQQARSVLIFGRFKVKGSGKNKVSFMVQWEPLSDLKFVSHRALGHEDFL